MWTDNGRLFPNNLKYAAKFEGKSSVTKVTSDRINESNNNVDFNLMTKDDMEFCDVITEKSEAVIHVTNSDEFNDDLNKTLINESGIKERIICLKPKKEKKFPRISEMNHNYIQRQKCSYKLYYHKKNN